MIARAANGRRVRKRLREDAQPPVVVGVVVRDEQPQERLLAHVLAHRSQRISRFRQRPLRIDDEDALPRLDPARLGGVAERPSEA